MPDAPTHTADTPTAVTLVLLRQYVPGQPKLVETEFEASPDMTSVVGLELADDVVSIQLFAASKVVVEINGKPTAVYVRGAKLSPRYYVADTFQRLARQHLGSDKATVTMLWLPSGRGLIMGVKEPAVSVPAPELAEAQA